MSSSVVPFSSCLQYFPTPGSFLMSWLFASGGQSIGASASVLPGNRWVAPKTATHAAGTGQHKEPNSSPRQHLTTCCTTNASEVERIGLWCFASSIIFIWPLVNQLSLFQASWKLFAGKTLPQPARGRKFFPGVWPILKHRFLHYRNKQTYSSLAKTCWLYWFIFWLIKMCLSLVTMI